MSHLTFADVTVDEVIDCGTVTVTYDRAVAFAEEYDPLDIHVDADAATDSPFGGVIASGFYTLALTQPLAVGCFYGDSDIVASRVVEELQFPAPVRPGDTLHVSLEIVDKRVSATDDGRGVVTTLRTATVDDEPVLTMRNQTVWRR